MTILPQPRSFHPPPLPDVGAGRRPDHVLLTVRAYVADRRNETTATSSTSEGHRVQVSFFAAKPPDLSYLCVYSPDAAFTSEPWVVASQGNLVLLGTGILSSSDPYREEVCYDHFVYSADGGTGGASSLDLLPDSAHPISRDNVGLVASDSCGGGGGGYAVVVLDCKRSVLHVHHEKSGRWRKKAVPRKMMIPTESAGGKGKGLKGKVLPFTSTKVITLQGSNIAWVDLQRAVLLCDVLAKDPVAYYIPLPEPLGDWNKECLALRDPCFFRDAIGRQDSIKFVEVEYRCGADFVPCGWKSVTYSWVIGSKNWCTDSVVDFEDVLENSGGMLSSLCLDRSRKLELKNIPPLCFPSLCDRDNVLYLMSKTNCHKGSVVVVDTSKKTLISVAPMFDERVLRYTLIYLHSTFSRCFNDVADVWPKMEDQSSDGFLHLCIGSEN